MSNTEQQPSTRERIIEATLRLIADRGFAGVTMKAVAENAGIVRQTLYNHFPDIDSIVGETIEAHQIESLDALRSVLATIESPVARLEHLVRQSAAAAAHHHPVAGIQHGLSTEMQPTAAADHHHPVAGIQHGLSTEMRATLLRHDTELLSIIEDTLQAGIDDGDFRPDLDVSRDAQLMKRMLDAAAELVSADPSAIHATVAAATRTLLASVAAPGRDSDTKGTRR
jgi:AcrR family transcriptional regulator